MTKITTQNAYNATDIRRRMRSARLYIIDRIIEEVSREIVKAADNNMFGTRVNLDCENLKNYNITEDILRAVRMHFEKLKFNVHISKFRGYILVQW